MYSFCHDFFDLLIFILRKLRVDLNEIKLGIVHTTKIVIKAGEIYGSIHPDLLIHAPTYSVVKINE